jgi:hypothetical protein
MPELNIDDPGIDDASELNHRMQVQEINRLRSDVSRVRNKVQEAVLLGKASPAEATEAYRTAVTTYAQQLAPVLQSQGFGDKDLWEREELARVQIDPPALADNVQLLSVKPKSQTYVVEGVEEFIEIDRFVTAPFKMHVYDPGDGEKEISPDGRTTLSRGDIDRVVRELDIYKQSIGLGLRAQKEVGYESRHPA